MTIRSWSASAACLPTAGQPSSSALAARPSDTCATGSPRHRWRGAPVSAPGSASCPRRAPPCSAGFVMSWPGKRRDLAPPPCLVVTDVAAEGLDLRRAARVVHYDLPWTPMRLEQREGRAVRLGSARELVEVVRFLPPPALDATLELGERLRRKAELPARAGLGADGMRLWRWRSALADELRDRPAVSGSAQRAGARGCPGPRPVRPAG